MTTPFDDKRPSQVLEHLFIGSRAHAKNRGMLKELGINRILNVTPPKTMDTSNGVSNFFEKDKSMTYKRVPVFDNRGEDLLQHFASCISFIEQGSFYGKVLVHCSKGVSRSSTVCAAYLMSTRGLTKDEALAYLRSRRPIVNPHEGFTAQLDTFETRLEREWEAAVADGQPPKFPDDLLGRKPGAKGSSIGPSIGPSRGPSPPPPSQNTRNKSPPRGPANRPSPSPSPPRTASSAPRSSTSPNPSRSPSRDGRPSMFPPRNSPGAVIGPSRGPLSSLPSVADGGADGKGVASSHSGVGAMVEVNGGAHGEEAGERWESKNADARAVPPVSTGEGTDTGNSMATGGATDANRVDSEAKTGGSWREGDGVDSEEVIGPIGPTTAPVRPAVDPPSGTGIVVQNAETDRATSGSFERSNGGVNAEGVHKRSRDDGDHEGLAGGDDMREEADGEERSVRSRVAER